MISISGDMGVPTFVALLYLAGAPEEGTPTRSIPSLSMISQVAGEVAIMRGEESFFASAAFFSAAFFAFSSFFSSVFFSSSSFFSPSALSDSFFSSFSFSSAVVLSAFAESRSAEPQAVMPNVRAAKSNIVKIFFRFISSSPSYLP